MNKDDLKGKKPNVITISDDDEDEKDEKVKNEGDTEEGEDTGEEMGQIDMEEEEEEEEMNDMEELVLSEEEEEDDMGHHSEKGEVEAVILSEEDTREDPLMLENKLPMASSSSSHIRELEKALSNCRRRIRELEEVDCDLSGDDMSVNLNKTCVYKKRCVAIYRKLAELRGKTDFSLGRKKFKFGGDRGPDIPEIARKIEKLINRHPKKGEGLYTYFPDYDEILMIYRTTNEEKNMGMSDEAMGQEARETFQTVGKKLRRLRARNQRDNLDSYLSGGDGSGEGVSAANPVDPADADAEMAEKLKENDEIAKATFSEVLKEYDNKQVTAEEIPDTESEEEMEEDDEA